MHADSGLFLCLVKFPCYNKKKNLIFLDFQDCYTLTLVKSTLIHSMSQDSSVHRNGPEMHFEEGERFPLDLNYPLPDYNVTLESSFNYFSPLELTTGGQVCSHTQATHNADGSDDDVVILSSPRSFLEVIFFIIHIAFHI